MNRVARALTALLLTAAPVTGMAEPARLDVLEGWRTERGTVMAAVRVQLDPGWKTYWRSPGEAGIPPHFSWGGSSNLAAVALHWPIPELFIENGMVSIGYHDQLILPVELTPRDPGLPIRLRGRADIGICADICIPFTDAFAADLPPEAGRQDARIVASLRARPSTAQAAKVTGVTCKLTPAQDSYALTATVTMPQAGAGEHAVIELPGQPVWVSRAETLRTGATLSATVDLVPEPGEALVFDRSALRITILAGANAVDIRGCS